MKKNKTNLHEVWKHSSDLAKEFIEKCNNEFSFLITEHGFKCESGLWDFSTPESKLIKIPDELSSTFLCIVRFTKKQIRIELSFGDREFVIEGRIWYNEEIDKDKFGLWEILNAAGFEYDKISGNMWINNSDFLCRTIYAMRDSLKNNIQLFTRANPQLITKAIKLREDRFKKDIREQSLHDLERARIRANDKFKQGEYKEVIEILMQYGDILSNADKAKITIAEKKIENEK